MALAWPLVFQILWTLVVLGLLGYRRLQALREGRARRAGLELSRAGWPDDVTQVSNNFDNQFQTPVLFYALCSLALATSMAGPVLVALAWIFCTARVVHTAIHVTTNHIPYRFAAFLVGVVVLAAMLVVVVLSLPAAAPTA